jgi:hypothetical protein
MQTNSSTVQNNLNTTHPAQGSTPVGTPPKALSQGPKAKHLGADPTLASWYEQAWAYYNAVQSGQVEAPDPAAMQELIAQMNWAYQQLQGGGAGMWDPTMGGEPMAPQNAQPQEMYYDYEENEITATGEAVTHRSFGVNDTLMVPSMAAEVTYEKVMDQSVQPPVMVLKVIVKNKITGAEEIFIFENAEDPEFSLTIQSPKPDTQISGNFPGDKVTHEEYDMEKAGEKGSHGDIVSIEGTLNKDTGEIEYEAASTNEADTIDFNPKGTGVEGDEETHRVWGNLNISVSPSDKVQVLDGADNPGDGGYTIIVTHKDGSKDIIIAMPGTRKVNINADPLNVTWGENAVSDPNGIVPEGFGDDITLNGGVDVEDLGEEELGFLHGLMELTGKDMDAIIEALNQAGFETVDGKEFESFEEVLKAIEEGKFPPEELSLQLIQFIAYLDDGEGGFQELSQLASDSYGTPDFNENKMKMTDRLIEIMDTLYEGEKEIHPNEGFYVDGTLYFMQADPDGIPDFFSYLDENDDLYKDKGDGWKFEKSYD